jgi:hypothetical protein
LKIKQNFSPFEKRELEGLIKKFIFIFGNSLISKDYNPIDIGSMPKGCLRNLRNTVDFHSEKPEKNATID